MWPRCESFDNVAVDGGALCVILLLFDDEFGSDCFQSTSKGGLVQRMHIQFASPQTKFKCERAFNGVQKRL